MFMGEYNHTVDAKGRLIVPAKFRELLGDEFVVTKGLDGNSSKKSSGKYHSSPKKPVNLQGSSLQAQQAVKWTGRGAYFFRQF